MSFCPECGKSTSGMKQCKCGWVKPKLEESNATDHQCHYQLEGRRCPLAGSVCPNPFGKLWYCPDHWRHLGDAKMSANFFRYVEANYHQFLATRRDWRRKLFDYEGKN